MEVRPGYKRTELGVIPEGWEVKSLGALGAWKGGMTPSMQNPNFWQGGDFPWISSGDVKVPRLMDTSQHVTQWAVRQGAAVVVPANSLVLVTRSGILRKYLPVALVAKSMAINQDIKALVPCDSVSGEYLLHALTGHGDQILASCLKAGTTVESVEFPWLKAYTIPLPPLPEQCTIATALSDVDALLAGLDRLIAKKRDLKKAAMQQLLTGQTRLPGFHGDWAVKRLGDHVMFLRNGVNPRAELLPEGRVKYLHYGDIHASTNSFLSPQTLPSLPDAKAARLDRLRDGDVIFADASEDIAGVCKSVELRGTRETEVVSGLHTIAARFDNTVLADGFKGLLQSCPSFATHLRRLAAGTKVYATNRAHIASVEMRLPPVIEQSAIANVLSDMDAELTALEARRDKTRALKQGMMQELLTGRTRLV